jgi:hypothetical protein
MWNFMVKEMNRMSQCRNCPTQTVVDPPITRFADYYYPQIVQVIHPIEIVRRHHCVPVPVHIYTCTVRDENVGEAGLGAGVRSLATKRRRK